MEKKIGGSAPTTTRTCLYLGRNEVDNKKEKKKKRFLVIVLENPHFPRQIKWNVFFSFKCVFEKNKKNNNYTMEVKFVSVYLLNSDVSDLALLVRILPMPA